MDISPTLETNRYDTVVDISAEPHVQQFASAKFKFSVSLGPNQHSGLGVVQPLPA